MLIGGFQACSFSDFPGELAAIIFTVGCNLRCGYCHNPQLVLPDGGKPKLLATEKVLADLEKRRAQLSGVVLTGGEPLLQADLAAFMTTLRDMGYRMKLDTNGCHPQRLQRILDSGIIDYVAMDIKDVPGRPPLQGPAIAPPQVRECVSIILASGIAHEFRTTAAACLHDGPRLCAIADTVRGGHHWHLQRQRGKKLLDPDFPSGSPTQAVFDHALEYARSIGLPASIR